MTEEAKVTDEELEAAQGEELPDREEMAAVPFVDPISGVTLPVEPQD